MPSRRWFVCGALFAAIGVMNGAYAAHGLADRIAPMYEDLQVLARRLEQYETGVRYQMYQSFGLIALGLVAEGKRSPWWRAAGFAFVASIVLFSGMLYLLVAINQPRLGMIVPIGGVAAVIGWSALALGAHRATADV